MFFSGVTCLELLLSVVVCFFLVTQAQINELFEMDRTPENIDLARNGGLVLGSDITSNSDLLPPEATLVRIGETRSQTPQEQVPDQPTLKKRQKRSHASVPNLRSVLQKINSQYLGRNPNAITPRWTQDSPTVRTQSLLWNTQPNRNLTRSEHEIQRLNLAKYPPEISLRILNLKNSLDTNKLASTPNIGRANFRQERLPSANGRNQALHVAPKILIQPEYNLVTLNRNQSYKISPTPLPESTKSATELELDFQRRLRVLSSYIAVPVKKSSTQVVNQVLTSNSPLIQPSSTTPLTSKTTGPVKALQGLEALQRLEAIQDLEALNMPQLSHSTTPLTPLTTSPAEVMNSPFEPAGNMNNPEVTLATNQPNETFSSQIVQNRVPETCQTRACVKAAANILSSMDESQNPCDDFYQFSCGGWNDRHVLGDYQSIFGTFGMLDKTMKIKLNALLRQPSDSINDLEAVVKAKDTFASCMNENKMTSQSMNSAREFIDDLGGFPAAGILGLGPNVTEASSEPSVQEMLEKIFKYKLNTGLFEIFVYKDMKNENEHILYIDQPSLSMPRNLYQDFGVVDNPYTMAYVKYATAIAELFQDTFDNHSAQVAMQNVVDLETQIASITSPPSERRDPIRLYNRTSVGELQTTLKGKTFLLDWQSLFQSILDNHGIPFDVHANTPIINRNYAYFMALFSILDEMNDPTSRAVLLQNYITFHALTSTTGAMPQEVRALSEKFVQDVFGVKPRPRWQTCVSVTNSRVPDGVGRLYVDNHFDAASKLKALDLVGAVGLSIKEVFDQSPWMSSITKEIAKNKTDAIKPKIGYPKSLKNDTLLYEKYENLNVTVDDYYGNTLNAMKFHVYENLQKLTDLVDKDEWKFKVADINAYYNPTSNHLMFPSAILQEPFFDKGRTDYLNYGAIAQIIAHEATHGFDDSGRHFDANGKIKDWWSSESALSFTRQAECIIRQYGNFTVPEINKNLNARLTLNENVADNGGLKIAYKAWKKQKALLGNYEEPGLPGLEKYSNEQLFFISAAQVWCGVVDPREAEKRIRTDTHAHFRYRVIGPMQNSEAFSSAFKCTPDSYMNPTEKCAVW